MPEEYGGSALGITEAAIMMQAISESGAGQSGASSVHMNIFGLNPVVVFGTDEQKKRFLPPLIKGREKACFAVTEPDAGLNTTKLKTKAVRKGERYVVSGAKVWISTAQVAEKCCCSARTDADRGGEEADAGAIALLHRPRPQARRGARDREDGAASAWTPTRCSSTGSRCPVEDRIGEEGRGFEYYPARHESRAHPDRRGGRGDWARWR
jgi:acyl-CoA dehydrogenase